jgi:DNA-binding MarR family transcriptional regulator
LVPNARHHPLELEHFLPYRLSVLSNRISGAIARLYARRFRLTIAEWRVMAVLGRFGPLTATDVSARTAMDKVRVSRAIQRLIAARIVSQGVEATDRRRRRLALTEDGETIYARIVPLARAAEQRLLEGLSSADRQAIDALITRLSAAVLRLEDSLAADAVAADAVAADTVAVDAIAADGIS